jgi:uncharacterized protein (DUF952 family)
VAIVYHIAEQLVSAGADYHCNSLETEGFIHCCLPAQLPGGIERYYRGVTGLFLLEIDSEKLISSLVFENTVGGEEQFPHVYGVINRAAIVHVVKLEDHLFAE